MASAAVSSGYASSQESVVEVVAPAGKDPSQGSIVRVTVHNFMTYTDATVYMGPRMNFVLGPNGAGKSSLVCAICLGLAGKPSDMARSAKLDGFIKRGETEATVEVELRNDEGRNHVIKRTLRKAPGTSKVASSWMLNGASASTRSVEDLVIGRLNIRVNNLCQFLPQELMGNLSLMNPAQILIETETALDPNLLASHKNAISTQKDNSTVVQKLTTTKADVERLTAQVDAYEEQADKIRQREKLLEELSYIRKKLPWREWQDKKLKLDEVKAELKAVRQEYQQRQTALGPHREKAAAAKKSWKAAGSKEEKGRRDFYSSRKLAAGFWAKDSRFDEDINNAQAALDELATRREEARGKLKKAEDALAQLLEEQDQYDGEELSRQLREAAMAKKEAREASSAIRPKVTQIEQARHRHTREFARLSGKLKRMKDTGQQRTRVVASLSGIHNSAIRLANEVKKQGRMSMDWWGPVALDIHAKEVPVGGGATQKFEVAIETAVPWWLTGAFVVQSKKDADTLYDIGKSVGIRPDIVTIPRGRAMEPDVPITQAMRDAGIVGTVRSAVDAPDAVLMALEEGLLHKKLLLDHRITDEAAGKVMEQVSLPRQVVSFFSSHEQYSIHRSFYNNKSVTYEPTALKPSRYLSTAAGSVDTGALEEAIAGIRTAVKETETQLAKLKQEQNELERPVRQLTAKMKSITAAKQTLAKLNSKVPRVQAQVERLRRETHSDDADEKAMLQDNLVQCHMQRCANMAQGAKANEKAAKKELEWQLLRADVLQACIKMRYCDGLLWNASTELRVLKKKLDEKKQEKTALASQLKQEHRKLQQEAPVEEEMPDGRTLEQHFNDFPEDIEELRNLAASCEAQANAIIGSKDVLERYKAAKAELQAALQRLAELEQLSAKATSVIQQHKDDWLSALKGKLTQIAASFKSYFEGINCRAELRLVEDDTDFAKYGIGLYVKFRDAEELKLMGNSMSGGERAVTTMLYLLAMQAVSPCPFRVVDEMNQGMDHENERAVFNLIVNACKNSKTQYIVLTPKLLTNLMYEDHCRVLVVFNGSIPSNSSDVLPSAVLSKLRYKRASPTGGGPEFDDNEYSGEEEEEEDLNPRRSKKRQRR